MRVTGSHVYARPAPVPKMPSSLEQLMEGLTKDVLRNNPTNVYDFCANHMLKLLEIRDGPVIKRSLTLEEKISNAQDRVRQRARDRWQRYDRILQSDESKSATKSNEEGDRILEIKQVLQVKSAVDNVRDFIDSTEVEYVLTEPNHLNQEEDKDIIISEVLIIDHDGNGSKEEALNGKSFNESNNDFQNSISSENTAEENSEIPKNFTIDVIENTEGISQTIEQKLDNKGSTNEDDQEEINQECDNNSQPKIISGNPKETTQDKKGEKKSVIPSTNWNVKNEIDLQKTEQNNIQLTTESLNTFYSNTPGTLIKHVDSGIKKSYAPSDDDKKVAADPENSSQIGDDNKSAIEGHISSNVTNKFSCHMDVGDSHDEDMGDSRMCNNEKSDPEIDKALNSLSNLDNGTEIDDNFGKINTSNENAPSKKENFEVLFNDETRATLQENIEFFEKDLMKCNDNVEESDVCNFVKNDENIHESGNMNLETAAITIQKVFRNFLFKSRASTYEEETNDESNTLDENSDTKEDGEYSPICANLGKERRPLGNMRMDTVLQTVNEEKSLSLSTDDSSTLSSAATIIQAHVRGFLVRNKLGSRKTSTNSLVNSNGLMSQSLENDVDLHKIKTPLNIHIVPETEHFLSRDESMIVSMDLSLDGSPPNSINLHPLGYDKTERRKLKREDAIQSFSPPSEKSGKLSEDVDSVKDISKNDDSNSMADNANKVYDLETDYIETEVSDIALKEEEETNNDESSISSQQTTVINNDNRKDSSTMSSDEMDVVTPFSTTPASTPTLSHTGEFHDVVLPTKVSRGDTSVVREFKNVLVYFLLWNHS